METPAYCYPKDRYYSRAARVNPISVKRANYMLAANASGNLSSCVQSTVAAEASSGSSMDNRSTKGAG
jgi:hypothetical protein